MERVPPFADPALRHPSPIENHMFESTLAEEITHGQAGVATADDDCIDLFVHSDFLKRAVTCFNPAETFWAAGSSLAKHRKSHFEFLHKPPRWRLLFQ